MKKSNKGFSLVELIIVIAIMAVLIAVLAPQYLQYVEKTKKNSDATSFSEVVKATEVAIADPVNGVTGNVTVTWTGSAFTIDNPLVQAEVNQVITGSDGDNTLVAKSKAFATGCSVTFTIDSNGNWSKASTAPFDDFVDY